MGTLLIFIVLVAAAAGSGAKFQPGDWYAQLAKPAWTPPNWLFAPAWAVLYLAIAVAGWDLWRRSGARLTPALVLWIAQLVLNALWSWLFFGLRRLALAFADIVLMLACIVAFIALARAYSVLASWLFVPYALWVAFASALNFAVWQMNKTAAV
jgi:tryptophan-rich sensory protein